VHNPSEVPGDSHSVSYLDLDRINFVQVRPKVYTVDERLKKWKPKERGCYYQRERRLSHFKIYTQRNCDLECEANATLKKCGCVSKHHPSEYRHLFYFNERSLFVPKWKPNKLEVWIPEYSLPHTRNVD
ncbi:hypothetical protein AAG570_011681, partial [Ranatra chinensis]